MFPFLTVFMILIIALALQHRYLDRKQEEKEEAFWAREREANTTLAKDITNLPYITIPMDKFPLNFSTDSEIVAIEDEIKELAAKRLLNLTGKTNTDLKLEYGVPNFETMQSIGEDFDRLCVLLNAYAKALVACKNQEGACSVLEFAVGIKTDVSESYVLLAGCYKSLDKEDKLEYLITQVNALEGFMQKSILNRITEITSPLQDTDDSEDSSHI